MSIHRMLYQCTAQTIRTQIRDWNTEPQAPFPSVSPAFQDPTLLTSDAFDHLELLKLYLFRVHMESEEDLQSWFALFTVWFLGFSGLVAAACIH